MVCEERTMRRWWRQFLQTIERWRWMKKRRRTTNETMFSARKRRYRSQSWWETFFSPSSSFSLIHRHFFFWGFRVFPTKFARRKKNHIWRGFRRWNSSKEKREPNETDSMFIDSENSLETIKAKRHSILFRASWSRHEPDAPFSSFLFPSTRKQKSIEDVRRFSFWFSAFSSGDSRLIDLMLITMRTEKNQLFLCKSVVDQRFFLVF